MTGKWDASQDAKTLLAEDDELHGDFMDLETGEVHRAKKDSDDESDNDDNDGDEESDEEEVEQKSKSYTLEERKKKALEKRLAKKARLKQMFDSEYDNAGGGEKGTFVESLKQEAEQQAILNRGEFADLDDKTRTKYEGFRPGMYVRVQIKGMPCEFVEEFDPTYPVILGGLLSGEQAVGMVCVSGHFFLSVIANTVNILCKGTPWIGKYLFSGILI